MSKIVLSVLIAVPLILVSCSKEEKQLKFQLPDESELKQMKIEQLEKQKEVHYEQYVGFILGYEDSLFKRAVLILKDNNSAAGADVLNEKQIAELKPEIFESLRFAYKPPNGSTQRNLQFESIIRNKFNDFDEEIKLTDGFELKKKGKSYVKVNLYNIGGANYIVQIYPKE